MTFVDAARRAWLDVGRAAFLANPVLVAFLAVAVPSSLFIDVFATSGPWVPWLAVSGASTLTVVALLIVVRSAVRRMWPDGPGPWRAIGIYAAAGALRGLMMWAAAESLSLATSVGLMSRVLQSAVWSLAVMGCASILITRRDDHRALMDGLARRQQELLTLESTLDQRIQQTHEDLVEQVQDELGPTLAQLRTELDALAQSAPSGTEDAVEEFRKAVADVVRPLSRTLAEPVETHPATPEHSPHVPPARAEPLPAAAMISPGASTALALVLTLLTFANAPGDYRTAAVPVRLAVLTASLWLSLRGVRWIAQKTHWRTTPLVLLGALGVVYVAVAVLIGTFTREVTSGFAWPTAAVPAVAFAFTTLAPWAISAARALQWLAQTAEVRSTETVAELERLTAALRRELWHERRRLALTVHGPIQSALVAAAVTMSRPGFSADQIPSLAATLDQAMTHIHRSAGPPPPVAAAARDLAALWVESAAVTFASTDDVAEAIDADDALRAVVIEVMREGVSNAVRHGDADGIAISLIRDTKDTITVTVIDDGDGAPIQLIPGLGSAMFDEVALHWRLVHTDATTRLEVVLAVGTLSCRLPCARSSAPSLRTPRLGEPQG